MPAARVSITAAVCLGQCSRPLPGTERTIIVQIRGLVAAGDVLVILNLLQQQHSQKSAQARSLAYDPPPSSTACRTMAVYQDGKDNQKEEAITSTTSTSASALVILAIAVDAQREARVLVRVCSVESLDSFEARYPAGLQPGMHSQGFYFWRFSRCTHSRGNRGTWTLFQQLVASPLYQRS